MSSIQDSIAVEWSKIEPIFVELANSMLRIARVSFEIGFKDGITVLQASENKKLEEE